MINVKEELLSALGKEQEKIVCARIDLYCDSYEERQKTFLLKCWFSSHDYDVFLQSLDFEYDDGYGFQELFGTVWLTNGVWMKREEYEGFEYWKLRKYPPIPENLKENRKVWRGEL